MAQQFREAPDIVNFINIKNTSPRIQSFKHSCLVYVQPVTNSLNTADVQSVFLLSVLIFPERMTSDVQPVALFLSQNFKSKLCLLS